MDFFILWIKDFFNLSHKLERQMAVVKDNPFTLGHSRVNLLHCWNFLLFSHGSFPCWVLLLLFGEFINCTCWVRSCRNQIEDWLRTAGLFEQFMDLIGDWLDVFISHNISNELIASQHSSIFSQGSYQAEMDKVTDVLIRLDLLFVVWNWHVFGLVLIDPFLPNLLISVDSLW